MECPKCWPQPMVHHHVEARGVVLDACPACKGIWFDGDELQSVLRVAVRTLEIPSSAAFTNLRCPRCDRTLRRFPYPQTLVKVDMCDACGGLWLDHGEFNEIKAVRETLDRKGALASGDPVAGIKGALLRFIDDAVQSLRPW